MPPLVLALVFGAARGALVPLHTRFLIAIPILLWAEGFVDSRVQSAVASFTERGLVKPADLPRFQSIVADAERLHHSVRMAVAIVAIAFGISSLGGLVGLTPHMTAGATAQTTAQTTAIEWWVAFLSLPLFRIVLLQWVWRWAVWAILMARTSLLDLDLEPAHPDLAGGLGFLEQAAISFLCLQVATGAVVAGRLAAKLLPVRQEIAGFTLITAGDGAGAAGAVLPQALPRQATRGAQRTASWPAATIDSSVSAGSGERAPSRSAIRPSPRSPI